ncbi:O-fucosyltransferase 39 isoform X1 [Selaginella moellendorffii]|nr:O-fucosyltransferase 39 isoform X1 [Selaginella moellendorffii]|eukprot:XP_024517497.1 O-fucosyltransferase 39 isoform X1 [Selaginella moellendorffii]
MWQRHRKAAKQHKSDAVDPEWKLLLFLLLAAGLCGYRIGGVSEEAAWTIDLFSEYDPPRLQYRDLVESFRKEEGRLERPGLWDRPSDNGWKRCPEDFDRFSLTTWDRSRYFQVLCGGGLFQLHICVCNAVAVARLLNATLVIPYFKHHPFWNDPSQFEDIYDLNHFMSTLKGDVKIVTELPAMYSWSTPSFYWGRCLDRPNCMTFLPKHTTPKWFFQHILPIMERYEVAAVDGFEHKLTFEGLPASISKLRCKVNFYALRFVKPIRDLGDALTLRMRTKTLSGDPLRNQENSTKKYIGLHVRFERDMLAYSSCDFGGGQAEQKALASFRYQVWSNRVIKALKRPSDLRRNGSCPLTPEEIGLLLAAFGFTATTPLYIAGKAVYGGPRRMEPLKSLFPLVENKHSLATRQELAPFRNFAHKLTALDFRVLFNSDVYMSNAAGNLPNVLTGHRSYFGPYASVHPDKARLATLLSDERHATNWTSFAERAFAAHESRMGAIEPRKSRYSVFRYPAPDCMCLRSNSRD